MSARLPRIRLFALAIAAALAPAAAGQSPTYLAAASVRVQPPGQAHADVLAVDWDGDGFRDLITTNLEGNTLGALHGLPGGRFEPLILSPIGPPASGTPGDHAFRAAAADLDGDGELDVVTANPDSHDLTVLLGDGAGVFTASVSVAADGQPVDVALADFDANGFLDLVTVEKAQHGPHDDIVIRPGDGLGGFGAAIAALTNEQLGACAVADVDADGWLDVVGAAAGALPVAFGDGALGFSEPLLNPAAGAHKHALVLADVDRDLILDAVMGDAAGRVVVRLGEGGGSFDLPLHYAAVPPDTRAVVDLALADVTGEGAVDVVTANRSVDGTLAAGADAVSVLRGTGFGTYLTAVRLGAGENPAAVALADFDRDGFTDIAAGPWALGHCALLWNRGGLIPLGVEQLVKPAGAPSQRRVVALADLSPDGDLDVLAIDSASGELDVQPNHGAGSLGPLQSWPTGTTDTFTLDLGDLNGDFCPDAVVTGLPAPDTYPLQIHVLAGTPEDGFGTLTTQPLEAIEGEPHASGGMDSVALGDWNGDGLTDAVVTADFEAELLILLGDGAGGFGAPVPTPMPGLEPRAVEAGDMDGDGDLDLVVAGGVPGVPEGGPGGPEPTGFVEVLLSDGAGGFTASVSLAVDRPLGAVELADLDADGALDVLALRAPDLVAPDAAPDLWIWMGDGAGLLADGTPYDLVGSGLGSSLGGLAAGDVDGDGLRDVAVTASTQGDFADDRLLVLPGDGQGNFGAPFDFACGSAPRTLVLGRLDGDNLPEAVIGTEASVVSVLRNIGPQPWRDLGDTLGGTAGDPLLVGQGHLEPASPMRLSLARARPFALAYLVVSDFDNPTPFHGGTFHPVPLKQAHIFVTNAFGQVLLSALWPPNVPLGVPLVVQYALVDPLAPAGVALSNAVLARTQ